MVSRATNRFALFATEENDDSPPWSERKANAGEKQIPPESQPLSAANGNRSKQSRSDENPKTTPKVLVIRNGKGRSPAPRPAPFSHIPSNMRPNLDAPSPRLIENEKRSNDFENWCGVCRVRFPDKASLQSHAKHTLGHDNYCNLCRRVFVDRNGLSNHVENSAGHEVYCNVCLSAFQNSWGLQNHFQTNASASHQWVCWVCLKGFATEAQKARHFRTSPVHVCCMTCSRTFPDQEARDKHWETTTKHKHCLEPGCDFDAVNAAVLARHVKDAHFQCEGCLQVFPSSTKLNTHVQTCHGSFRCEGCHRSYSTQNMVATHQLQCDPYKNLLLFSTSGGEDRTMSLTPDSSNNTSMSIRYHQDHNMESKTTNPSESNPAVSNSPESKPTEWKCWLCSEPFSNPVLLIKHLETRKCPEIPSGFHLIEIVGKWWHSVPYMDVDIHAGIVDRQTNMEELAGWMKDNVLSPYMCRAEGCGKKFNRLSSLAHHLQSDECEWGINWLRLEKWEEELTHGLEA